MPINISNDLSTTYRLPSKFSLYQTMDIQQNRLSNDWHLVWDAWSFQQALENKSQAILLSISACEILNLARYQANKGHLLQRYAEIASEAKAYNIQIGAHISCVSGSPFSAEVDCSKLRLLVEQLIDLGCRQIVLADTCSRADSAMVETINHLLLKQYPQAQFSWQFNDASAMAFSNIQAAIGTGMTHLSACLAGVDKTQLAQWQFPNLSTEDLTFLLQAMGYCQQLDFSSFVQKALLMCQQSQIPYQSQSGTAWLAARAY